MEEYERLETRATYQFENTYLYDPWFYNSITKEVSLEEIRVIYLNMTGLNIIDRFQCLRNDINLMSADVICISNTTSNDNFSVILQDFEIIYQTKELVDHNSKGMIIYKKAHIDILSVETYKETYYESALCRFQQGYICFIYFIY